MKSVHWKLLKLLRQNQSADNLQLWPWPLHLIMYRCLPLTILHLCMKYESWTLNTTQVIVSESKCRQSSVVTLTFDLFTSKCIGIFLTMLHLCMKYERCTLKTTQVVVSEPKCWQSAIVTLTFDLKMYKYLSFTILHLCMKYKSCTLTITQIIVSEPKRWQSSIVTLTFGPHNVKVSSFYHPASMYEIWKL